MAPKRKYPDPSIWPVLTQDYNQAWEYYKINLEERGRIYENFFKTIGIPSVVISAIIAFMPRILELASNSESKINPQQRSIVLINEFALSPVFGFASGLIVLVFALAGLSMYILHCYEEYTSKDYMKFINQVRSQLEKDYTEIAVFLKKPPVRRPLLFGRAASFWRTVSMNLINSLLFSFSLFLILNVFAKTNVHLFKFTEMFILIISIFIYIIFVSIHLFIQRKLSK